MDISRAQRLVTAIINCSDVAFPFYREISSLEKIGYAEAKDRLKKEVMEYIGRDVEIQRHENCSLSLSSYLGDNGNLLKITMFLLRRYGRREKSQHYRLVYAIQQI